MTTINNPTTKTKHKFKKNKNSKLVQPKKYTAFDRLYNNGKQKQKRIDFRTRLNEQRPPSGCTFYPQTNGMKKIRKQKMKPNDVLKSCLSSMIDCIIDVDGSNDKNLLVTAYSSNMRKREIDFQDQARLRILQARRRERPSATNRLYEEGMKRRKKKEMQLKKYEQRRPNNCTFQPETTLSSNYNNSKSKKINNNNKLSSGRSTPNYMRNNKKYTDEVEGKKKTKGKKKKRYEYLYEQHEAQRKERQLQLKEATSRKDVADDEGVDGHLKPILCTALALHEFKGKEGTNELSFPEGVMIGVTEMDNDDGWWHGKLEPDENGNSKWGSFPFSYVHCILNYKDESYMMDTESNQIFEIPEEDTEEPEMIGTYNLETQMLKKSDGTEDNWYGATLFKMDWETN